MMVIIVTGRRQVKRMDVYLQPIIDEFKKLWEGIHANNVSRPIPIERYLCCMEYVQTPCTIIQD
jgi:hypothetical protein